MKHMQIKEYDKIRLTTDEIARVVEIFDVNNFLAEIFRKTGGIDTTEIGSSDIQTVFVETEHPYTPVQNI